MFNWRFAQFKPCRPAISYPSQPDSTRFANVSQRTKKNDSQYNRSLSAHGLEPDYRRSLEAGLNAKDNELWYLEMHIWLIAPPSSRRSKHNQPSNPSRPPNNPPNQRCPNPQHLPRKPIQLRQLAHHTTKLPPRNNMEPIHRTHQLHPQNREGEEARIADWGKKGEGGTKSADEEAEGKV
jgi:hypothetical protein